MGNAPIIAKIKKWYSGAKSPMKNGSKPHKNPVREHGCRYSKKRVYNIFFQSQRCL